MAKKMKKQNKKTAPKMPDNALPQNIMPMGERVEENKNIYISQPVYKEIHKFTKNKTTNESGGMLVGTVIEELGKTNIIISGFVEAKYSEGTPTTLKFTHETWDYVHKQIEKKHPGKKILGWIHTHPDFGIFLSEYDKFIHQNFFSDPHQIAYVVDPIQKIEGFYFWINENLEKCKGFYIYDETGTPITVDANQDDPVIERKETSGFTFKNLLIAILTIAVILLGFSNYSMKKDIAELKNQYDGVAQTAAYNQYYVSSIISILQQFGLIQPPAQNNTTQTPDSSTTTTNADGVENGTTTTQQGGNVK